MKIPDFKVELIPPWAWAAIAGAGVYLAWKLKEKGVAGVTADLISGTAGAVGSVAAGAVKGVGQVVGIPDTNAAECASAMSEGRTWAASLYCPAATFAKYLVTPKAKAITGTVKPAGQASPSTGIMPGDLKCSAGGICDGTDLSGSTVINTTGAMPGNFDLDAWINQSNGTSYGKTVVPVAGIRG